MKNYIKENDKPLKKNVRVSFALVVLPLVVFASSLIYDFAIWAPHCNNLITNEDTSDAVMMKLEGRTMTLLRWHLLIAISSLLSFWGYFWLLAKSHEKKLAWKLTHISAGVIIILILWELLKFWGNAFICRRGHLTFIAKANSLQLFLLMSIIIICLGISLFLTYFDFSKFRKRLITIFFLIPITIVFMLIRDFSFGHFFQNLAVTLVIAITANLLWDANKTRKDENFFNSLSIQHD